jgi:hypothetical protein
MTNIAKPTEAICSPCYALAAELLGRSSPPQRLFAEADRLALAAKGAGVLVTRSSDPQEPVADDDALWLRHEIADAEDNGVWTIKVHRDMARHIANSLQAKAPETWPTDDQIKQMVNRFLMWKLPADFSPDNGISLKNVFGQQWPIGTNLFTAAQAETMIRYMIEGLQAPETPYCGIVVMPRDEGEE